MANLRTAIDSAFWDLNVSSPRTLDGSAKAIPGEPFPLDGARASRVLRVQQLSLLGNGFPLGIIPSYGPAAHKELGSFSLQTLLLRPATSRWLVVMNLFFVGFYFVAYRCVWFLGNYVLCFLSGTMWGMGKVLKYITLDGGIFVFLSFQK